MSRGALGSGPILALGGTRAVLRGLALALTLHAMTPVAQARQGQAAARQVLQQGIDRFNQGELGQSRPALRRVLTLTQDAALRSQAQLYLGLSDFAEGRSRSARRHFCAALVTRPALKVDPERYKPAVVAELARARKACLGRITVSGTLVQPGAAGSSSLTVWIDGRRSGTPPVTQWVAPGAHRVQIKDGAGAPLHDSEVQVAQGSEQQVVLTAAAIATGAPAPRPAPERPSPKRRRRIWTWVAGGAALATGIAALGVGLSAWSDRDAACDLMQGKELGCDQRDRLSDPADAARYATLYDRVSQKSLAANVLWGVSGALAVTTVVLLFVEGSSAERAVPRSGARLLLSPAALGLQLSY